MEETDQQCRDLITSLADWFKFRFPMWKCIALPAVDRGLAAWLLRGR